MRKFHPLSIAAIIFVLAFALSFSIFAHPGRTDSSGGHTDQSTGDYHYHHGYEAHQHNGEECPFDFDDRTGQSSGISSTTNLKSQSSAQAKRDKRSVSDIASTLLLMIVVAIIFVPIVLHFVLVPVNLILDRFASYDRASRIYRITYYICLIACETFIVAVFIRHGTFS